MGQPSRRPSSGMIVVTLAAVLAAGCGSNRVSTPPHQTFASRTAGPTALQPAHATFDVTQYGAVGNGVADNTTGFSRAISAAQATGGGTVVVPPGRYMFSGSTNVDSASILIPGNVGIALQGSGRDQTYLIEAVKGKGLLSVFADSTMISGLTMDTQTHDGGAAIFVRANHTSLLHTRVLGSPGHFALYYAGPAGAMHSSPTYNMGNTVEDLQLNELNCDDGFSWSFQQDSRISDVVHTGSRLALYVDADTTVTNYQYTPGPQQCAARNGFWLTPPGNNISIVNFVSSGEGGKVGVTGQGGAAWVADNITIRGEILTGSGNQLSIGDVRNLQLEDCNLGNNAIVIVAQTIAQGTIAGCRYSQLVSHAAARATVALTPTG